MSSTSDQTTNPSKETRLIIGEVGVDTETGIVGKGHSYDNGNTFIVDDTIYGRIYHADDQDKIWALIKPKISTINGAILDTSTDFNGLTSEGHYDIRFSPNTGKNGPNEGNWGLLDVKAAGRMVVQTYYGDANANVYVRNCHDGTTWTAWREITF